MIYFLLRETNVNIAIVITYTYTVYVLVDPDGAYSAVAPQWDLTYNSLNCVVGSCVFQFHEVHVFGGFELPGRICMDL